MGTDRRIAFSFCLGLVFGLVARPAKAQDDGGGTGEITKMPQVLRTVPARYPPQALEDRVSGSVTLEFTITATGAVADIQVVQTSTQAEVQPDGTVLADGSVDDYGFVQAAVDAVKQFAFEPAESNGTPIPVTVPYQLNFDLPPPPEPRTETSTGAASPGVVNFEGTLRERGTRSRLAGVIVTVFRTAEAGEEPEGFETATDEDGHFEFYDLAQGEWKVLAEKDGYFPVRTTEAIGAEELTEVTYFMEKGAYNPYDVEVVGQRVFKEVSRRRLTGEELKNVPGTLGDPIANVENLPGVARTPFGTGALPIRGSAPGDSGIFFEGIETPQIFHVGGLKSVIPAELVEAVEFIPGNFSAYYGRKTGGILDVQIKKLDPDQVHGILQASVLDGNAFLEVPLVDEFAIGGGFRRSFIGEIADAVIGDDNATSITTAPSYIDYQALMSWRPAAAHQVQAFFFGSRDQLEFVSGDAQELSVQLSAGSVQQEFGFDRVIAQYTYAPGEAFTNEFQVGFGFDQIAFSAFDFFEFSVDNYQWQVRNNSRIQVSDDLSFDVGLDGLARISDVFLVAPDPDQSSVVIDLDDTQTTSLDGVVDIQAAPYFEANWKVTERLELVPGIRFDYFSRQQELAVEPRLSARYQLADRWRLAGGVGLYTQPPLPQTTDETFGNPNVGLERSVHTSVGVGYSPLDFLDVDVTFFYKRLFDFVSSSDDRVENEDGTFSSERFANDTTGDIYGMELFVDHKFHRNFRGYLFYTLSRSTRTPEGEPTILFDFDQTHIFGLVASYQFPSNWELGVRWRLISGNLFTPVEGGIYLENQDSYQSIPGDTNSARLDPFNQLDIRLEKRWITDTFQVKAFLQLINTYNAPNPEGVAYNFDFTESDTVRSLPIFPVIGAELDF